MRRKFNDTLKTAGCWFWQAGLSFSSSTLCCPLTHSETDRMQNTNTLCSEAAQIFHNLKKNPTHFLLCMQKWPNITIHRSSNEQTSLWGVMINNFCFPPTNAAAWPWQLCGRLHKVLLFWHGSSESVESSYCVCTCVCVLLSFLPSNKKTTQY